MTRFRTCLLAVGKRHTGAEIGDAPGDRIFCFADGATKLAVFDQAIGDGVERGHEPGVLVRLDASQKIQHLDEHRAPLAVREPELVDINSLGLRESEYHGPNDVVGSQHRPFRVRIPAGIRYRHAIPDGSVRGSG